MVSTVVLPCLLSVMPSRRPDLAPEDAVADGRIEKHQREDEETLAPEHEGKARMRRGGLVNSDRERHHVGPERDRQRAERCRERDYDHREGRRIPTTADTRGQDDRGDEADRRKDEKQRPLG